MTPSLAGEVVTYSARLDRDFEWALKEGGRHFQQRSEVHASLLRICQRLTNLGVPYCVVGDLAMFKHGYRRFTEKVELLVTRADLAAIHRQLSGSGYVEPFVQSKHLLDAQNGVEIQFIVAGESPGDRRPKPVVIPHPSQVSERIGGIPVISLSKLIELKLAASVSSPGRLSEFADVQEILKAIRLPRKLATQLHADLQAAYLDLWNSVQPIWQQEDAELLAEQTAARTSAGHANLHR